MAETEDVPSTEQRKVAIESSEVITASTDYNCEWYIDFNHQIYTRSLRDQFLIHFSIPFLLSGKLET